MDSKVETAIREYYKLQQKYKTNINKKKQKIMDNSTLDIKQKRKKWLQIKKKCINCNREGGTIFESTGGHLIAMCGNANPCNLNININRGYYTNIRDEVEKLYQQIDVIKGQIIETKLKILFHFVTEESGLKEFEKLRKRLSAVVKSFETVDKEYIEIISRDTETPLLREKSIQLFSAVQELSSLLDEYKKEENPEFIKTVANDYIQTILPLAEKIRNLKYVVSRVEPTILIDGDSSSSAHKLVQEPFTLNELYVSGYQNAKIVDFIVDK